MRATTPTRTPERKSRAANSRRQLCFSTVAIRLIAGLGNPGPRYARTRHNVGAAWLDALAQRFGIELKPARRFKALVGRGELLGHDVRLLFPTTYVNLSGEALGPAARYYRVVVEDLLVAYDEVAFPPGISRLKQGGGHNGHNGLKSVIAGLGNERGFARLRIGVGHPGSPEDMVAYLTGQAMPAAEAADVERSATLADEVLGLVLEGRMEQAMNVFHAPAPGPAA